MYTMPWALPGPIGAFLTTGLDLRSLVLMAVLLVVDFVIYYPFCKAYDHQLCLEESAKEAAGTSDADAIAAQENAAKALEAVKSKAEQIRVLVLCQGAGTSTLLANALREGAAAKGIDLVSQSGAYGSHYETMDQYNVIVLAPQARMYYDAMKPIPIALELNCSPQGASSISTLPTIPKVQLTGSFRSWPNSGCTSSLIRRCVVRPRSLLSCGAVFR